MLGLSPAGEQPASFAAVSVAYHTPDGHAYELVLPQAARVCLPRPDSGCGPGVDELEAAANAISDELLASTYIAPSASPVWVGAQS
jgi:hypothetical protein